ncbi:hypothetical protein CJP06_24825 [Klebsiella pneumoniae]|nr:hypothetical protein CWQ24_18680 [Klebsiella pneumoniae]PAC56429.1 hypothetical protein CJP06_24825 [Klebsiella pneumoniae]
MFAGKKSAQIREILISESAWEEMTCLFAPSLTQQASKAAWLFLRERFLTYFANTEKPLVTRPRTVHMSFAFVIPVTCISITITDCMAGGYRGITE